MSFVVRAKSTTLYLLASLFVLVGLAILAPRAQTAIAPDAPRLMTARAGHTATALANGTVLVAGGVTRTGSISNIEFLDVANSQSKEGPRLLQARGFHTATVLADGRVLLAGGRNQGKPLASSEIYDPATSSITAGPSLGKPRAGHTATLLLDGRVLFAGGDINATAELYDPTLNAFVTISDTNVARSSHAAIRLANGNVLLVGGRGSAAATAEIFNAVSMRFTTVRDGLKAPRVSPELKLLPDGKVQVFGGDAETTMELFNPKGYFSSRGHLLRDSNSIIPVLHSPARGALVGLWNGETAKYHRSALGSMSANLERTAHTITSVPGKETVVIVGGTSREGKALDSVVTLSECTATVTTDLTDYSPGQTVIMSGAGWLPGEAITLNLHRDTNDPPDTGLYATADANGNWTNAEYVVQVFDLNVTFVLTASGESGCVAQTTFTDAPPKANFFAVGLPAGTSLSVSYRRDSNGGGTDPLVGGCPASAGTSPTFTPPASASTPSNEPSSTLCFTYPATIVVGATTYNLTSTSPTSPTILMVEGDTNITGTYAAATTTTPTTTTVTFEPGPYVYRGTQFTATAITTGAGGFSQNVTASIVYSGNCTNVTSTNGCTATASFAGNATHQASSGNASITITPATPVVGATGGDFVYTGLAQSGSCSITGVNSEVLVAPTPTYTPTSPPVNVGDYTVHCDYLASGNYTAASDTADLKITPATPVVEATGGDFVYTGLAQSGSCSITGVNSEVLVAPTPTYTPTSPPVNVGDYTVHCDYLASGNYTAASDTADLKITPATPVVEATGGDFVYTGLAQSGSCSITGVNSEVLVAPTPTYTPTSPPINVGDYTVHCDYLASGNYTAASDTADLKITPATPVVEATGGDFVYTGLAQSGSCSITGVNSEVLVAPTPTYTPTSPPINVGDYTVHCDYLASGNYTAASDTADLKITPATPVVEATGGDFVYTGLAQSGSCSITGVNSEVLVAPTPTYTPTSPPINVGDYTVHCDYLASGNYTAASDTADLKITPATLTVTAEDKSKLYLDPIPPLTYVITGFVNGETVATAPVTGAAACTTTATAASTVAGSPYPITCTQGTLAAANYDFTFVAGKLTIGARDALVNYIGQQTFVTSGSSATTAQVTLSASVQDPTGTAITGATMDFIDVTTGKVLASGVTVSQVPNSPANTGTANKIVTLSTGQFGAESYLIKVVMTGNYDNTDQSIADKTATVVIAKPADTNETCGVGTIAPLATSAGQFPGTVEDVSFTVGMKYNKSGSNLQGKLTVSVPQADGTTLLVKSNSISSMAITNGSTKTSTIYTKATLAKLLADSSIVTIDGNVTLRMDIYDGVTDKIAITVLSSKDSKLYYSNQWVLVGTTWKSDYETFKTGQVWIKP